MGMGGRSNRKVGEPSEVGNIFDHFAVEYTYPDGSVMQSYCRQIAGCANSISEALVGTKGTCQVNSYTINGKRVANDDEISPYKQEHIDLIRSIREGKPLNELQSVTESTLTAIMGRMSSYSGKEVKWDDALNSQLDSFPSNMSWDMALTTAPAAVVGQTRAV